MNVLTVLKISRPRFWLYLAGPYLVGYAFGLKSITEIPSLYFFLHFLYFLIPANIFLYGVNDICDEDTDQFNQKKGSYEHRLLTKEKSLLFGILVGCVGLSFFLLSFQANIETQLIFILFLLLSFFYSAPPLRFKAKPVLDFSSNILYALPGLFAYYQTTASFPPLQVVLGIFCWTFAMHLFSSVPDINADKKAALKTTAVLLGKKNTLILCAIFWTITAVTALFSLNSYFSLISLIYPLIPLLLLTNKNTDITKTYKLFPLINTGVGFLLFLLAVL